MNISDRLFRTAIQDLDSVEILFKAKHYNIALFQLQQTIEKLVKSFGIKTKIIKPEDIIRRINHLPHKVFSQFYQNQIIELSKPKPPSLVADMVPPHQRGKNYGPDLEQLKQLNSEILNSDLLKAKEIPIEDVEKFIKGALELEKDPTFEDDKLYIEIKDDFVKTHEHFIKYFEGDDNIKTISEDQIRMSDEITRNKLSKYKLSRIQQRKFGYISYVWINLSLLTSSHEQATRYPSISSDAFPGSIYTENHPLIKYLIVFVEMVKKL